MERAAPMRDAAPFGGFPGGRARQRAGSRRKRAGNPWREGCRGSGLPGSARAVPRSRVPRRVGSTEGEEPPAAAPPASGVGCYAMDSAKEPSLLTWCLSRALPALTTIMSMPSKRTGTSPRGV